MSAVEKSPLTPMFAGKSSNGSKVTMAL